VGYIRTGCFHLLFSAGCPLGERQLGVDVPLTFEQLDVGPIFKDRQPRSPGCLPTKNVEVGRIRLRRPSTPPPSTPSPSTSSPSTSSPSPTSPPYVRSDPFILSSTLTLNSRMLEYGSTISFRLTGRRGAALVTKYETYSENIQRHGTFKKYAKEHHASWVTFACEAGHGDDINPVLVTGVDRTRDFAMFSYSNSGDHCMTSEFAISAPKEPFTSTWGTWQTTGFIFTNCGPQLSGNNNPESVPDLDLHDKCVFVRYYTVRKRLGIPKVIKAGAGPHDLGSGSGKDGRSPMEETRSPSDSGSDAAPSLYDNDEDGDGSSATSIESGSDTVIHNTVPVSSCLPVRFCPFRFTIYRTGKMTLIESRITFSV
jgi:hypothetical protein